MNARDEVARSLKEVEGKFERGEISAQDLALAREIMLNGLGKTKHGSEDYMVLLTGIDTIDRLLNNPDRIH